MAHPTTRRSFLAGAAALGLCAVAPSAHADEVGAALERIARARQGIRTLVARFRQVRRIALLGTEVTSRGTMRLVLPGRLRWELEAPDHVVYWVTPEGFAMTSGDTVNRVAAGAAGRFAPVLADLMVLIGGDLGALRERYELEVSESEAGLSFSAKPKSPELQKRVRLLRLHTGKELWQLRRVEIREKTGDASLIDFERFERDVEIDPELMRAPD